MKLKKNLVALLIGVIGFSSFGNINIANAATSDIIINSEDGDSISYDDLPQEIKDLISNATTTTSQPKTNTSTKSAKLTTNLEKFYVKKVIKTTTDELNNKKTVVTTTYVTTTNRITKRSVRETKVVTKVTHTKTNKTTSNTKTSKTVLNKGTTYSELIKSTTVNPTRNTAGTKNEKKPKYGTISLKNENARYGIYYWQIGDITYTLKSKTLLGEEIKYWGLKYSFKGLEKDEEKFLQKALKIISLPSKQDKKIGYSTAQKTVWYYTNGTFK